jgi:hypothetical protein
LSPTHDEASWTRVKRIFNSVLQHPDQIKRATDDILRAAADENVRCTSSSQLHRN